MAQQHGTRFIALVDASRQRIRECTIADIKRRTDAGETFHLVDVREYEEWCQGHLPGAIHMGKGVIERDVEQEIADTDAEIVLYCGGGYRSALAADNLQKMGYSHVISMDGGYRGWLDAGLEITSP